MLYHRNIVTAASFVVLRKCLFEQEMFCIFAEVSLKKMSRKFLIFSIVRNLVFKVWFHNTGILKHEGSYPFIIILVNNIHRKNWYRKIFSTIVDYVNAR